MALTRALLTTAGQARTIGAGLVRPHRLVWVLGLIGLGVFTATRIGLTLYTGDIEVPSHYWPGLMARGAAFDLAALAWLLAPLILLGALTPTRWRRSRLYRRALSAGLWFATFALLFGAVAEVTFWLEFSTRFNFIAVDYLVYTQEVIDNVRESYPVGTIVATLALLALLISWPASRLLRQPEPLPYRARWRLTAASLALLLPAISLVTSDLDQMRGSDNEFANELSGNGLYTFVAALRRNELDYDSFYRILPQARADQLLSLAGNGRDPLGERGDALARSAAARAADHQARQELARVTAGAAPADAAAGGVIDALPDRSKVVPLPSGRARNVVLISVESLSASFLGAYGDRRGLTPRLDEYARQGLLFERMFATGTRTVRGLEALSLGIPPVPGQAVVRRPDNGQLATIGTLLRRQGFSTLFFYGGYGYFDNMNAYFAANDYRVVDRTDIPAAEVTFANAWGVADETLFDQTLRTLDLEAAGHRRFFAHVMTTSNHRPYTYPDGRIDIPSPGGRDGAVKYTDHAIGRFLDQARTRPWFHDTLFVIVADHCASAGGRVKLPVHNYHIPAILYAPALIRPGRYPALASQIDLPPTLLQLLGARGSDQFFGQPLFGTTPPDRAFLSNHQELGLYRDNRLTVLLPKRQVEAYGVDPDTFESFAAKPRTFEVDEVIAWYQTAARSFTLGALRAR